MELSTIVYTIGKWSGVAGFFCLSFLIFSGDTARFWDRWFGLDRIIKFQRKFSLFTALFVILHPIFFMLALGDITGFLVPDFTYVPLAVGIISLYIFVLVMLASQLYKRVSYRAWQYIHAVTYILFFMALYHAFNWGSDAATIAPFYVITLIAVIIGALYRTQYKIRAMRKDRYVVRSITPETHDTYTLHIESETPFRFEPGQFCFLRLDGMKLHARHPFTIASAPHEKELRFTIKDSGRFTAQAKKLAPGSRIHIDGPFGRFKAVPGKKLVCIAGGVGITPFMSIILHAVHTGRTEPVTLLYGSKTEKDIIFRDALDRIDASWLKTVYVLSDTTDITHTPDRYTKGFITAELIRTHVKDDEETLYYICGPEIMKRNVKDALTQIGVPHARIRIEDFFW